MNIRRRLPSRLHGRRVPALVVACGLLCSAAALGPPAFSHEPAEDQLRALSISPEDEASPARKALLRAELNRILKRWTEARAGYRRARLLEPGLAEADYGEGRMLLEAGRAGEAMTLVETFLDKRPGDPSGLLLKGRTLSALGRRRESAEALTAAVGASLDAGPPPSPELFARAAWAWQRAGAGGTARALELLRQGSERLGGPVALEMAALDIEEESGMHDAALARLERLEGRPAETEAYYSFDFGTAHFISLNSQDVPLGAGSLMLSWLEQDLLNASQDWIIAFWHHPPYSKGSHDSDDPVDSGGRMEEMRQEVNPILESWGVDLILSGHSHSYERSFLLDGHYGDSNSILPGMILDPGDGRVDGTGAYSKLTAGPAPHEGAVYVVAGSSGATGGGSLDHPAMYVSWDELGSLVLDIEGDRLDATFINSAGAARDQFTLIKSTATPPVADFAASPAAGATPLTVSFRSLSSTNTTSWAWDLDGDLLTDSTQEDPSFVYTTAGLYDVSLTAGNAGGSDPELKPAYICVLPAPPAEVTGLAVAGDGLTLSWNAGAGALAYDLVKGNLSQPGGSGVPGGTVSDCIENDAPGLTTMDAAVPAPGEGFFYLVRGVGDCTVPGTYDGADPSQVAGRDTPINGSPLACP